LPLAPRRVPVATPSASVSAGHGVGSIAQGLPSIAPVAQGIASQAIAPSEPAPPEDAAPDAPPEDVSACNAQPPQDFLIRTNYINRAGASADEKASRKRKHREAIEYRTRRYGFVKGFGSPDWNIRPPADYSDITTFFGIKIRMNKRVIPALQCVEEEIRRACSADVYEPHILDGIRFRNTFHDGEITNHAFGIAIDVDPDRNSCCGCVPPLNTWPRCLKPSSSPFDRARIPRCWVEAFTRYGFYWLGHDPLEDTMHFEFLGDPDRILKGARQDR
jgi:hypothetical protein